MALVVIASSSKLLDSKKKNKVSIKKFLRNSSQVVQTSQNEARSSTNSSSRGSTATAKRSGEGNKEYFFGEETLENKWKNHDSLRDDASSVSSLDDWVRSDSSRSSSKYVDRVSLTVS